MHSPEIQKPIILIGSFIEMIGLRFQTETVNGEFFFANEGEMISLEFKVKILLLMVSRTSTTRYRVFIQYFLKHQIQTIKVFMPTVPNQQHPTSN